MGGSIITAINGHDHGYSHSELRAVALVLQHIGVRVAEDMYGKPYWDVRRTYVRRPSYPLLLEVPKDKVVYVLYAKPGISLFNARQSLAASGIGIPQQPFATLWEFNMAIYVSGKDTTEASHGLVAVADEARARLWSLTGKCTIKEPLGYRPGDNTSGVGAGVWEEEPQHVYTGPKYPLPQAQRINRFRWQLAEALVGLGRGLVVYARREDNDPDHGGSIIGPLKHSDCMLEWPRLGQRVADLLVAVPQGKTLCIFVDQGGSRAAASAVDTVLGEPTRVLRVLSTAIWLLDEGKLPGTGVDELPNGVVTIRHGDNNEPQVLALP